MLDVQVGVSIIKSGRSSLSLRVIFSTTFSCEPRASTCRSTILAVTGVKSLSRSNIERITLK